MQKVKGGESFVRYRGALQCRCAGYGVLGCWCPPICALHAPFTSPTPPPPDPPPPSPLQSKKAKTVQSSVLSYFSAPKK